MFTAPAELYDAIYFSFKDYAAEAAAIARRIRDLFPGLGSITTVENWAGLRPATPDNLPAIGRGALDGLLWATGHFRNGILLAPLTAELIAAVATGEPLPDWAAVADPRRFAKVPA